MFPRGGHVVVQLENKDETEEIVLKFRPLERLNHRKLVVIKIGEFQRPIEFGNTREEPHLYCTKMHQREMFQAIFAHLSALFHRSSPKISVLLLTFADFKKLIGMSEIAHTGLDEGTVDAQMLDEHFKKYPNQISTYVGAEITGQFSEDSAFLKVPTIHSIGPLPISVLKQFNGRELRLCNLKFDTIDVIQFLNEWISGVSYQNLELLFLNSRVSLNLRKHLIYRYFGLRRWPKNTPHTFEFKSRSDLFKEKDKLVYDCRRYYQVVRENDHKLAALKVKKNYIEFFVFQ